MIQSEGIFPWVDCLPRGTVSSMRQDAESAMKCCEDSLKTTTVFRECWSWQEPLAEVDLENAFG